METYSQNPIADATVESYYPNNNFGSLQKLYIARGSSSSEKNEIYVKFDLSGIPKGSTLSDFILRFFQYDDSNDWLVPPIQVAAAICADPWDEGAITWNNKPVNDLTSPLSYVTFDNAIATSVDLDVTSHIQAIVNGLIANNGFRVYYTGSSNSTRKYFRSREYGTAAKRPVLFGSYELAPIKVFDGQQYVNKPLKVWDGSNWVKRPLKRWDGSAWVNI